MNEEENLKPNRMLDCIGLFCPIPIFNTAEEMEKIDIGQVLEMVTGDPAAVHDIPRWAKRAGHQFLKLFKEGEHYHFLIRKG